MGNDLFRILIIISLSLSPLYSQITLAKSPAQPAADPALIEAATTAGTLNDQLSVNAVAPVCQNTTSQPPREPAVRTQTIGGVVATVNATPIYANQVLDPLKGAFALKANELGESEFRQFAAGEINRKLKELIEDELYFSFAYNGLSADDRELALANATQFRKDLVTASGGSVEQARRKSLENGEDFDEALRKRYRQIVRSIYQKRRIEPLIHVSPEEMRAFYRVNAARLYGGGAKPFDDQKVQDDIYTRLREREVADLSRKTMQNMLVEGGLDTGGDRVQVVLDMAMQDYAQKR
jgi:hypothetical protein